MDVLHDNTYERSRFGLSSGKEFVSALCMWGKTGVEQPEEN